MLKEFIQHDANEQTVTSEMSSLLEDEPYRHTMLQNYEAVYQTLNIGSASETAAQKCGAI